MPDVIPHNRIVSRNSYEQAAVGALRSGWWNQGPEVEAFEKELAERFRPGAECAVVSSGTAALYLSLLALDIVDPWIPTYSCSALLNAVRMAGQTPVVKDVDPETFNYPGDVTIHTYGVPLSTAFSGWGWIEDFTHAAGGIVNGSPCGSLGALSVISFGATKPMGIGSGGAILGPKALIEEVKARRDYDQNPSLDCFNWQLSDIMAAIGREKLKNLIAENFSRECIASYYLEAQNKKNDRTDGAWYRYVIRVNDPKKAMTHFSERGIETIVPLRTDELLHRRLGLSPDNYPNAEHIARTTLSLPIWPGMSTVQVKRVAEALREYEE